jgi:hypothetical protein
MESSGKKSEEQRVNKPAPEQVQSKGTEQGQAGYETSPLAGQSLSDLPAGPGTRGLRQAAVLQMQKTRGNAFVMRQMAQRQHEEAPAEDSAAPSQISGGGASVSTEGGIVNISGPLVNVSAPMITTNGVLRTTTLIADNVVASSYTPGAGNVM